jgi:hypothetical protein
MDLASSFFTKIPLIYRKNSIPGSVRKKPPPVEKTGIRSGALDPYLSRGERLVREVSPNTTPPNDKAHPLPGLLANRCS